MTSDKKKTYMAKEKELTKSWFLLDAQGKTLGRFATEIANILRGKHKPTYTPNFDAGDGVIVINAEKIEVTGAKEAQKLYRYYTGHVGGLREVPYKMMKERKPDQIIELAVKGMMPKTKLSQAQIKKLKIFAGPEHNLQAQQPIAVEI